MGDGTINGRPIPQGYARVTIDRILDKKYNKIHIEYTAAEDMLKLGHNKGSQVAWRKRFIKLGHQL
jgi:predicted PP-loop superfamily ATPase